jgi:hypothetical protein
MQKLTPDGFRRARELVLTQARPLERTLFLHLFEGGEPEPVLDALAAFQNPDGGFGRALEPDLRLPASSALATITGLDVLRELDAPVTAPMVRSAIGYLVASFDPALPGWRSVPPAVEGFPHANHWSFELHAPGGPWDHFLIPGARILSHLHHWREQAPAKLLDGFTSALVAHVEALEGDVGGDSLYYCASLVETPRFPAPEKERIRKQVLELGPRMVSRDPAAWSTYVSKPLKLAPFPSSPLAAVLEREIAQNLDWEIEQQSPDGSWQPNWSWRGEYPETWEIARREWNGHLTLRMLQILRAWGRS